jgi:hypothetical protein
VRSAGITDLRHASLLDSDWQAQDRFADRTTSRDALPLPEGVRCYAMAGSMAKTPGSIGERIAGDGLVPLYSALGQHRSPRRHLGLPESRRWIGYRTHHLDLLSSAEAYAQIHAWLVKPPAGAAKAMPAERARRARSGKPKAN